MKLNIFISNINIFYFLWNLATELAYIGSAGNKNSNVLSPLATVYLLARSMEIIWYPLLKRW